MAVQVALGVLASLAPKVRGPGDLDAFSGSLPRLLFVLNIIEPVVTNNSALRGLGFCDQLAAWAARGTRRTRETVGRPGSQRSNVSTRPRSELNFQILETAMKFLSLSRSRLRSGDCACFVLLD